MGREIGRAIEPMVFEDYASTVSAMRDGRVQLGWMENKNAIAGMFRGILRQLRGPIQADR
jgi:ABC-type phosphate/phosphonate transport system substrate-binding protein